MSMNTGMWRFVVLHKEAVLRAAFFLGLLFRLEHGGSTFLGSVTECIPDYTASLFMYVYSSPPLQEIYFHGLLYLINALFGH
jgi:hypothetical protein